MPPCSTLVFGMAGRIVRELRYFGIVVGSRLPPGTGSAQAMGAIENANAEKTAAAINLGAWILSMIRSFEKERTRIPFAWRGFLASILLQFIRPRCPGGMLRNLFRAAVSGTASGENWCSARMHAASRVRKMTSSLA